MLSFARRVVAWHARKLRATIFCVETWGSLLQKKKRKTDRFNYLL